MNKETGYNLCDQTSSCAPMISGPLPHQATSVATITAGQQPGLSTKKQTDTCYMLFYVPFTPIIQCPEDEIYVPTLSANHPKIYLNLTTLGVQETCQPHAYKSLATCTVKPFLWLKNCTVQSYSVSGISISYAKLYLDGILENAWMLPKPYLFRLIQNYLVPHRATDTYWFLLHVYLIRIQWNFLEIYYHLIFLDKRPSYSTTYHHSLPC